ncbi:MAG: T9SS type A sorting domain-containing protein [Chitinophagales bacterium]|nr:T9SS type A sorting domain-containing protein [Chitinophagales bacterium]MBP9188739.1 T9SS type A sorting domain-containing protein [Chitinophagales bacterium]
MKKSKFHIKEYSAFAASFLLIQNDVAAEVIYGDIIPDTLIKADWESFDLDLNEDGVSDFRFLKRSLSFTDGNTASYYFINHFSAQYFGPLIFGNLVAGNLHVVFPSYGGFTVYFPYALAPGVLIDQDNLEFQTAGVQTLAYRYRGENSTYFPHGGNWYPEVSDHYVGLYFKDTADCYHYGWVRLDVGDLARELVIKDFAYETECDHPIVAGDTISYVEIKDENNLDAIVYSFDNTIYVKLNEHLNDAQLFFVDITGNEIYSNSLHTISSSFVIDQPSGIYIVRIFSNEKSYSKKVYIN